MPDRTVPDTGRIRRVIDQVISQGRMVSRANGSEHEVFPIAVPATLGEALRAWVVRERAARTIEIGLGFGISTPFISAKR